MTNKHARELDIRAMQSVESQASQVPPASTQIAGAPPSSPLSAEVKSAPPPSPHSPQGPTAESGTPSSPLANLEAQKDWFRHRVRTRAMREICAACKSAANTQMVFACRGWLGYNMFVMVEERAFFFEELAQVNPSLVSAIDEWVRTCFASHSRAKCMELMDEIITCRFQCFEGDSQKG